MEFGMDKDFIETISIAAERIPGPLIVPWPERGRPVAARLRERLHNQVAAGGLTRFERFTHSPRGAILFLNCVCATRCLKSSGPNIGGR